MARAETKGLGRLQSAWLKTYLENNNKYGLLKTMEEGEWAQAAQQRYIGGLTDTPTQKFNENLDTLLELLSFQKAQITAFLGEMNIIDYFDDETMSPKNGKKHSNIPNNVVEHRGYLLLLMIFRVALRC